MDKNKQFKNELLMESLHHKSNKSFLDLAKSTRLNLLEKRYNIDAVEKQTLQKALDSLQPKIPIKNRTLLVERLESITRNQLLKFTDNVQQNSLFISSDMFYLEILLDPLSGKVIDVKVHHECSNESESEPYLIEVLRKGDFIDFTQQLEGLQSIYMLNAESKIKSKAFESIQALETDLITIHNAESMQLGSPEAMVMKSSCGFITKRRGGHPMKILFFVRPTECLNLEEKRIDSLSNVLLSNRASEKMIGNSATINLEASAPSNKLQLVPLLIKKSDGNGYSYNQNNLNNSAMLPAAFVLRLNKNMPITSPIIDEIKKITSNLGVLLDETSSKQQDVRPKSLVNLIIEQESEGSHLNGQKGLLVPLADQTHCYFISDNNELVGAMLKSIQFTEGRHVTKIIKLLRQQALFNAMIGSCVRKNSLKHDLESYMFEINIVSLKFIQIFVEHPVKESIVTVEFNLSDVRKVAIKINTSDHSYDSKLENYIHRVFQLTLSIPMVLRSLIKYWNYETNELQRIQKRLYNNGIYGNGGDDREKGDGNSGSMDDSFNGSSQDTTGAFDICGINKNEIFFKTTEQKAGEKRNQNELEFNIDVFKQQKTKNMMTFDLNDDEVLMNDELSPAILCLSEGRKNNRNLSMDVFEFNDPSPPPSNVKVMPPPLNETTFVPTPKESPKNPSQFNRFADNELTSLNNQSQGTEQSLKGQSLVTISISTGNSSASGNFSHDKPKSEKKKKRKREEVDVNSSTLVKKRSSDSLVSSPSKKSSSSSGQLMGKSTFKSKKSPLAPSDFESLDELAFLNYTGGTTNSNFITDQQSFSVSPTLTPSQNLFKGLGGNNSVQSNRKSSLSAVINKLKSEMSDAISSVSCDDKKGEYQIKSSGSDGIKITFNKTKSSKGSKSPKHTGLKPGVNSGPASKKSSQSSKSSSTSSSSHKLLFQKSNSSGSINTTPTTIPSPKSSSQPGKTSKERCKETSPFSGFSGNSNDMLKTMLNQPADISKAFDKNFQIPKLSARIKSDDKTNLDDVQNLNIKSSPSPTTSLDFMREEPSRDFRQHKFFTASTGNQQTRLMDQQKTKKIFKSFSTEQLVGSLDKNKSNSEISESDYQTFLRAQSNKPESSSSEPLQNVVKQIRDNANNVFDDDLIDFNFISNEI